MEARHNQIDRNAVLDLWVAGHTESTIVIAVTRPDGRRYTAIRTVLSKARLARGRRWRGRS